MIDDYDNENNQSKYTVEQNSLNRLHEQIYRAVGPIIYIHVYTKVK